MRVVAKNEVTRLRFTCEIFVDAIFFCQNKVYNNRQTLKLFMFISCWLSPKKYLSSKLHNKVQVYRLDICQNIYTTGVWGKKFYTLKVRKFRLFLQKRKRRKCISISYFCSFFVRI